MPAQLLVRSGVLWAAFLALLTAFLSLTASHPLRDAVVAKTVEVLEARTYSCGAAGAQCEAAEGTRQALP